MEPRALIHDSERTQRARRIACLPCWQISFGQPATTAFKNLNNKIIFGCCELHADFHRSKPDLFQEVPVAACTIGEVHHGPETYD